MSFTIHGHKYRLGLRLAVVATITRDGGNPATRHIASDIAVCNPSDFFDPEKGAKLAVTRALQRAFPSSCSRKLVWNQILGKVSEKARKVFDDAINSDFLARL
jgi:hypothetical protein